EEGGTFTQGSGLVQVGTSLTVSSGTYSGASGTVQVGTNLSVSGTGAFNAASGLVKISGNLSISGSGTFKASSGTVRVGGAFTNTAGGGAFNDNNGNFVFNATTAQTHTFGGATFKKVTFNDGMVAYWNLDQTGGANNTDNSGYTNTGN